MKYYAIMVEFYADQYECTHCRTLFTDIKEVQRIITYLRDVYGRFDWVWDLERTIQNYFDGKSVEESAKEVFDDDYGGNESEWEECFKNAHGSFDECSIFSISFDNTKYNSLMETE